MYGMKWLTSNTALDWRPHSWQPGTTLPCKFSWRPSPDTKPTGVLSLRAASANLCLISFLTLFKAYCAVSISCSDGVALGYRMWVSRRHIPVDISYIWFLVGRNPHELLIAPKPDNNPRIMVPRTISRERYAVNVSEVSKDVGTGM